MNSKSINGWSPYTTPTLSELAIFKDAIKSDIGVTYTPEKVSTKIDGGTNYIFICNKKITLEHDINSQSTIQIFVPENGKAPEIKKNVDHIITPTKNETVDIIKYVKSSAVKLNFSLNSEFVTRFPDIEVTNPEASMEGVELIIKGNIEVNINENGTALPVFPFAKLGFTILEKLIPIQNKSVDFELKITPGKKPKVTLTFSVPEFSIPFGSKSLKINNPKFTIVVFPGQAFSASFVVQGTLKFVLYKNQELSLEANFTINLKKDTIFSVQVGFDDTFQNGIKLPTLLGDKISLKSIGATMGIVFEPPGCLLGIEAQASVKTTNETIEINNFGIICDIEGDVPIPLYLAFGINKLSFADFIEFFTLGVPVPPVPIIFSNPNFTYCSKTLTLPDGTSVNPGFSISSELSFIGEKMYGSFIYIEDEELSANFQGYNDFIKIGPIMILGNAPSVTKKAGVNNSSIPTNQNEWNKRKNAKTTEIVPSGGPEFNLELSKSKDPELSLNGSLSIFNESAGKVECNLGKDGVNFDLILDGFSEFKLTLNDSTFTGTVSFTISSFNVQAFDVIISERSSFNLHGTTFGILSPEKAVISADLNYKSYDSFTANVYLTIDDTKILVGANVDISHCRDKINLIEILSLSVNSKNIITSFENNHHLWTNGIATSIILPFQEENNAIFATRVLHRLGVNTNELSRCLATIQGALDYTCEEVAEGLQDVFHLNNKQTVKVLYGIHLLLNEVISFSPIGIANSMVNCFKLTSIVTAQLFHGIGIGVADTAKALKKAYNISAKDVGIIMKNAGYEASKIVSTFNSLGGDFASAAKSIENNLNPKNW